MDDGRKEPGEKGKRGKDRESSKEAVRQTDPDPPRVGGWMQDSVGQIEDRTAPAKPPPVMISSMAPSRSLS